MVKWIELFVFYFLGIMALVFAWLLYDIWREYKKAKLNKKVKENLTKPAIGRKRKTASKGEKKKPAKRGRPKKPLA